MVAPTRVVPEEMVAIPAGSFTMGSADGYEEEGPPHEVHIPAFALDRTLVTNAQYRAFCDTTGRPYPVEPRWDERPNYLTAYPDYPVVNVTHEDATAYAAWIGKRLPTEAEWEYAALGGQTQARYPWGNDAPHGDRAQYASRESAYAWRDWRSGSGYRYTTPVGAFPPNGYGLHDMAGNVWEWCANWFYRYPWEDLDLEQAGEGWGMQRVVRGGCFHSPPDDLRVSRRLRVFGGVGGNGTGFRCAFDLADDPPKTAPATENPPKVLDDIGALLDGVTLRMERGVELCLGVSPNLTDEQAARIRAMGFTSVEQYVTWETIENAGEGQLDFSAWDEQVAIMKRHGLRWVPFLIAGPAYSLPDWYRNSEEFRGLVCLEHRIESRIQSIWDRRFDRHIERFMSAFAERYREAEVIESLLLGITGDFGEAIFPVTGTTWTTIIPGYYHTHGGYWCGDRYAEADFRRHSIARFGGEIDALNASWGTSFRQASDIEFPVIRTDPREGFRVDEPTKPGEPELRTPEDRQRWLDFVAWYRGAMNDLADRWIAITRRCFPDHPIYLCTGGDAPPYHGAHFGDQCRIAAAHGAGIRITNEASNYGKNFVITHWVASAGQFYDAYFGFEPAGGVDERGVTGRIYNAAVCGAKNLHFYEPNIYERTKTIQAWLENFDKIEIGQPDEPIALLYPDTSLVLGDLKIDDLTRRLGRLRDGFNFDFLDDGMVAAGALDRYKAAFIAGGPYFERTTIETLSAWIASGGILAGFGTPAVRAIDGEDLTARLFSANSQPRTLWRGSLGSNPEEIDAVVAELSAFFTGCGVPMVDGQVDGVYAAQLNDRVVLLHHGHEALERAITMPDGSRQSVTLPPNSIVSLDR